MIFLLLHCFPTLSSKCPKGRFVALRFILYFDIVNFPFLDGDVPRRPAYGVYISQLIRFARVCSHVDDFNTRNKCLTAKLLKDVASGIAVTRKIQYNTLYKCL